MSYDTPFADVLAAAQHGSDWAWGQILRELGPPIQAYARSQGVEDPQDVLGQVLEGVVRGIDRFRGSEDLFRAWVFTIAHSRIVDTRRRAARRPELADRDVPEIASRDIDLHAASELLSREAALRMLEDLPDRQRDALALTAVAGLSIEEAARVMNKRPGAVRVAVHRAIRTIRQRIPAEV